MDDNLKYRNFVRWSGRVVMNFDPKQYQAPKVIPQEWSTTVNWKDQDADVAQMALKYERNHLHPAVQHLLLRKRIDPDDPRWGEERKVRISGTNFNSIVHKNVHIR